MKNQNNIPANEHLAVCLQPHSNVPRIYTFLYGDTPEELAAQLSQVKSHLMHEAHTTAEKWHKLHGGQWEAVWREYVRTDFYKEVDAQQAMKAMTWEEFRNAERQALIGDKKLEEIPVETYWDALESLPPLKMLGGKWAGFSWDGFLMSEFYAGDYTTMFMLVGCPGGEQFAVERLVDATDRTTWIKVDEVVEQLNIKAEATV